MSSEESLMSVVILLSFFQFLDIAEPCYDYNDYSCNLPISAHQRQSILNQLDAATYGYMIACLQWQNLYGLWCAFSAIYNKLL